MRIGVGGRHAAVRRELAVTVIALGVTVAATAAFVTADAVEGFRLLASTFAGRLVYLLAVGVLLYGSLVYQLSRLGFLQRLLAHRPATDEELDRLREDTAPSVVILVPSYKEERSVVRQTLLSACLQDYPNRRVVLLVDDPPYPQGVEDAVALERARSLPGEIAALLSAPARALAAELDGFRRRAALGRLDRRAETARLAALHDLAAAWYRSCALEEAAADHTGRFFVREILERPAEELEARAERLRRRAHPSGEPLPEEEVHRLYRRLGSLFDVELDCFERKLYANLSHEPNKAMNLNSYLALLGRRLAAVGEGRDRRLLPAAPAAEADLSVPATDYVVTLDADSLLLPNYVLRLVNEMERPGHERVAVAQTPYSAVPGAPGVLERVAGATTDIQYIVHQGFTHHRATYWVGANALLRTAALGDLMTCECERGLWVRKYIQDRTVIEDTESSVDLADRGWTLLNVPTRLAYSATPSDFGALVIQRRRWANGGLIILPKLLRYLARRPWRPAKVREGFMRVHYLVSIAAANVALLLLFAYPFQSRSAQIWLPLTALPYFALYTRDLHLLGYRRLDVLRVYALNLLLLPVNLGGVCKSLQQTLLRRKTPFGRTPKVSGRTAVPPLYVLAPCTLLLYCAAAAAVDAGSGRWSHCAFSALTAAFLAYAVARYLGPRESWLDATAPLRRGRSGASAVSSQPPLVLTVEEA